MSETSKWLTKVGGETLWLTREEQAALCLMASRKRPTSGAPAYREKKPGKSLSLGCHPKQVALMNDAMRSHNIYGVRWDERGRCEITSRKARARAMKVVGPMLSLGQLHDRDGCYLDG